MRQKLISIFILIYIFLCGCNKDTVSNPNGNKNINSENHSTGNSAVQVHESTNIISSEARPFDISEHTNGTNLKLGVSWETDKGRYAILPLNNSSYNIVFFDYALMKQYPLCNKPNCSHNGEDCNSFLHNFEIKSGGNLTYSPTETHYSRFKSVFMYNGRIYILSNNRIISMKPDGTDRTTIVNIPDKYHPESMFYVDGKFIIEASVYTQNVDNKHEINSVTAFLQLDISKKEVVELSKWEHHNEEPSIIMLGIFNENAYYLRSVEGELMTESTQEAYDRARNTAKRGVLKVNIKTGESETFIEDQLAFQFDYVNFIGNCIYYHSRKDKIMYEINLESGEKRGLITNLEGYCGVTTIVDGKLIYYINYNESEIEKKESRSPGKFYYDMKTGKTQEIKPISGGSEAIVFGRYRGDYLMKTSESKDSFQIGRISKADFWAGEYNKAKETFTFEFKDIKNILFGGLI